MYTPKDLKDIYAKRIYENVKYKSAFDLIDNELSYGSPYDVFSVTLPRQIDSKALDKILFVYKYFGGWENITWEEIKDRAGFTVTKLTFIAYGQTNSI